MPRNVGVGGSSSIANLLERIAGALEGQRARTDGLLGGAAYPSKYDVMDQYYDSVDRKIADLEAKVSEEGIKAREQKIKDSETMTAEQKSFAYRDLRRAIQEETEQLATLRESFTDVSGANQAYIDALKSAQDEWMKKLEGFTDAVVDASSTISNVATQIISGDPIQGTIEAGRLARTGLLAGAGKAAMQGKIGLAGGMIKGAGAVGAVVTVADAAYKVAQNVDKVVDAVNKQYDLSNKYLGERSLMFGIEQRLQQKAIGLTSGLSEQEVADIQTTLLNNRIEAGSYDYTAGMRMARQMSTKYGFDVKQISELYAHTVANGTVSQQQLTEALKTMNETVKNSDQTLTDVMNDFQAAVADLSKQMGGSKSTAESVVTELTAAGFAGDELAMAEQLVSRYDWSDPFMKQRLNEYQAAHPEVESMGEAMVRLSQEMSDQNVMFSNYSYGVQSLANDIDIGGKQLDEWLQGFGNGAASEEEFASALSQLPWGDYLQVTDALVQNYGVPDEIRNDPEKVAKTVAGFYETKGMMGADEETKARWQDDRTMQQAYDFAEEMGTAGMIGDAYSGMTTADALLMSASMNTNAAQERRKKIFGGIAEGANYVTNPAGNISVTVKFLDSYGVLDKLSNSIEVTQDQQSADRGVG